MTDEASSRQSAEIFEAGSNCSLGELCLVCKVDAEWVAELVEYGVLEPVGQSRADWQFTSVQLLPRPILSLLPFRVPVKDFPQ